MRISLGNFVMAMMAMLAIVAVGGSVIIALEPEKTNVEPTPEIKSIEIITTDDNRSVVVKDPDTGCQYWAGGTGHPELPRYANSRGDILGCKDVVVSGTASTTLTTQLPKEEQ